MFKEVISIIVFAVIFTAIGIGIGFVIPHDQTFVWDIIKDLRACFIEWDDGTYSYKSREISLGTILPGENKVVYIKFEEKELER